MFKGLTGAKVLLLVRDGIANDVPSLCREFELESYYSYYVESHIHQLERAGLIADVGNGRYEASENWGRIQSALAISLKQLAILGPGSMVVEPYLGVPDRLAVPIDLFVVMPLKGLEPIWEDHIKNVAQSLDLKVKRGNDFFTAHSVMSDVWNAIGQARVIIADCTGRNPNVFYEIGLAHAIGKLVVLITQNTDDIPFDVGDIRHITYEHTPRGMQSFEEALIKTLKTELRLK
jgi:hypothetical protein